jgi:YggT family protein
VSVIASVVRLLGDILIWLILIRSVLSWVRPRRVSRALYHLEEFLDETTEPILAPIRRLLPFTGGVDFSPLVAILLIYLVLLVVGNVL